MQTYHNNFINKRFYASVQARLGFKPITFICADNLLCFLEELYEKNMQDYFNLPNTELEFTKMSNEFRHAYLINVEKCVNKHNQLVKEGKIKIKEIT